MIKVGITGGIGSGKTTVAHFFECLDIPVYYSDKEAKLLMNSDLNLIRKIKELLGDAAYTDGWLNKAFVAQQIFTNKSLLEKINKIVHPVVEQHFNTFCNAHKDASYVLKESAILIETGLYKSLDKLILVTASKQEREKRVVLRDGIAIRDVQQRINKQWSDKEKSKFSDFIIENDNQSLLIPQLLDIHQQLTRR